MSRRGRLLALSGMWAAALAAVLFIVLGQDHGEPREPAPDADAAPVRTPDNRAPPEQRAGLPVSAPPEGPPQMFRNDRRHTGRSPYRGPASGDLFWRYETGGRITAQPVVGADGRVCVGSHDGYVHCVSSAGTLIFKRNLGGPVYSTALLDPDGNLYVGCDAAVFWALSPDGETRWRVATEGDADTGAVLSPRGIIHFAAGPELWAVQPDGAVQWKFRAQAKIYSTPAVDEDGTVYVGSQDDHVYAVAPDGRLRWSYRTQGDNDSSPVIGDDGTIYFGSDDRRVYALSRDGELRWSTDVEGYVRGPIGLGLQGTVIAGVFGPRPRIVSLSAATGELAWFFPVTVSDSSEVGVMSGPLVDRSGAIYVGAHDDYLYALAPGGQLRWAYRTTGDVASSPVLVADGLLVVGSSDHYLYAVGRIEARPERAPEGE